MTEVKSKSDRMYKEQRVLWLKERMFERCQLLLIELQIKIDHRSPTIQAQFKDFVKSLSSETERVGLVENSRRRWEKPFFRYAQYLD